MVLITGAGRGMGRDHALLLASRGAKVVVSDNGGSLAGEGVNESPAAVVVAEIQGMGGDAIAYLADISTEEGALGAVDASLAAFGRIDAIIHNASISPDPVPFDQLSTERIEKMLGVNTFAAFWLARAAWPHMVTQRFGRIVLIASHAVYGVEGQAPYSSAKTSYIGLVRSLAPEGAPHDIHINAIAPTAWTRMTDRFPASDFLGWFRENMRSEKVSPMAAFLCSETCAINGQFFSVAGGRIARITLAETIGDIGDNDSIEEVADRIGAVMADERFFYPENTSSRGLTVAELMGYAPQGPLAGDHYRMQVGRRRPGAASAIDLR